MGALPHALPGLVGPGELSGDRQFSINLSRGLQLLRSFTPADASLSHRELCERSRLPKATVSRLTYTLTMLGYLTRTADQRYALGAGVLSLGYPMLAGMRIRQIARPWLERLASETSCTVNLGARDRLNVVYVDSCRADRSNMFRPDIGTTGPLLTTSIGRALLLGTPATEQDAILNRLRVADPERFLADRGLWDDEREAYPKRGYCWCRGDWRPEVHAVAVPLRQSLHPETMAVNCTWSADGARGAREPVEIADRLKETARRIELACREEGRR
jgi:DNA-binding IclR family transcriptional regulator